MRWARVMPLFLLLPLLLWAGLRTYLYDVPLHITFMEVFVPGVPDVRRGLSLEGKPKEFGVLIVEKGVYRIEFVLHHDQQKDNETERAAKIIGLGSNAENVPTTFRVIIRNGEEKVLRDHVVKTDGLNAGDGTAFFRQVDEFSLLPGKYRFEVTPIGDFTRFKDFKTSIDVRHRRAPNTQVD